MVYIQDFVPQYYNFSALKFIKLRVGKYNYISEESYRNVFKTDIIIIHVHVYCSIKCREHNVDR